ncbi:hypothetical protein G3N18_12785 [Microbacterium sp. 2C]|nr:hypothetical protein [Microbacterium paulum]
MDPMASRMRRTFPAVGAALLALALVTGCAPEPAPTPTPTGFASDDEAFAAAEATYRAYVDALNNVDFADPATFEPALAWTTGEANAADKKDFSASHAEGERIEGDFKVHSFSAHNWYPAAQAVHGEACLDVSNTTIVDASGTSTVPPTRPPVVALQLTFTQGNSSTGLLLSEVAAGGGNQC